jgi:hypothetical protein
MSIITTGNWQLATGDDNDQTARPTRTSTPNRPTRAVRFSAFAVVVEPVARCQSPGAKTEHAPYLVRWVKEFLQFAKDKTGHKFEAVDSPRKSA